jgi:hypothetical protein
VIIWNEKPKEPSYIYFVDSNGRILYKMLSGLNNKNGFYVSTYVKSDFIDNYDFSEDSYLYTDSKENIEIFNKLKIEITELLREILNERRAFAANKLIESYEKEGIFPDYSKDPTPLKNWKLESLKNTIRILYSAEPTIFSYHLNKTQKRILVKLLDKVTVSPSEDLFDVLEGVVSLSCDEQARLAEILKHSSLGSITNAISEVRSRQNVINILNELNERHTKATKEIGEIQSVVENNLWLFGEQYHLLTAEEADFEKALKQLLLVQGNAEYYQKGSVTHPDKNKEMDIFAIRRNLEVDEKGQEFYRCLVVELKRPSDSLKDKHLEQLQKYFKVISSTPNFNDQYHKWDFVLTGRKITSDPHARAMIDAQLESNKSHGEKGLVMKTDKFRIFIKPWNQIFIEHNIRHKHLLKHLDINKTKVADSKDHLVKEGISEGKAIAESN